MRKLRETDLLSVFPPCEKMTETTMLPHGRVSQASSPEELNIIMSLWDAASLAMTLRTRLSRLRIFFSSDLRNGMNPARSACLHGDDIGYSPALSSERTLCGVNARCDKAIIDAAFAASVSSFIPVLSE